MTMQRREFLSAAALGISGVSAGVIQAVEPKGEPWFKISLAQWSLNRALFGKKIQAIDFPRIAKEEYGIHAVEYVNQFYMDKKNDDAYLKELHKRCTDLGVKSVLIMCDDEGALGDPDSTAQEKAVKNHYRWVEWAKYLGCHSIRVNAETGGKGSFEECQKRAANGLSMLTEFGVKLGINIIVENHGGLSSNGKWLSGVMKMVNSRYCGTLPDFGNFYEYDRYKGVEDMMPYAKGVSAKSHDFDAEGNDSLVDYARMLKIVKAAGYRGYLGIEYEGEKLPEPEGIRATKKLLERLNG
ncbi:MAG TPA: sugar phosphate isomerase/epimerase family protein [Gemmatales bacterium]|nr:sugar phosphate isomerase/epimerase family protein [Gemmatales bacterium]